MPKKYRVDTDKGSYIVETEDPAPTAPSPTLMASRKAASASEFDANQPSLLGGLASEAWKNTKALGSAFMDTTGGDPNINDPTFKNPASALVGAAAPGTSNYASMGQALRESPAANLLQAAKRKLAGGDDAYIRQQLGGSGKEGQAVGIEIAPKLAQDPQYLRTKGALFDQHTFEKFNIADAELKAAELSVPKGTVVQKAPILSKIDAAIEKLRIPAEDAAPTVQQTTSNILDEYGNAIQSMETMPGEAQYISGHKDALKVLAEERNELAKFPDQIPFDRAIKYRRQLDDAISTHSGWKETGNAADQAAMKAKREVVNAIRAQLSEDIPSMKAANEAYGTAADAMSTSGLHRKTGIRLSTSAKPPKPGIIRRAAPYAAGAGAAAIGAPVANKAAKVLGLWD